MKDGGRQDAAFLVRVQGAEGEQDILARAVIDASGTIEKPGALGASGLPALGERGLRGAASSTAFPMCSARSGAGTPAGACSSRAAGTRR